MCIKIKSSFMFIDVFLPIHSFIENDMYVITTEHIVV